MLALLSRLHIVPSLAGLFQHLPFLRHLVQLVRCSLVNHITIAISAYRQVPHLHLGGVRQWFIEDLINSRGPCHDKNGTHNLVCVSPVSYPRSHDTQNQTTIIQLMKTETYKKIDIPAKNLSSQLTRAEGAPRNLGGA